MSLDITDTLAPNSAQVNADDFAGRIAVVTVAGVEKIAFDRSGYRYHGRIKALADAAREGGLQF